MEPLVSILIPAYNAERWIKDSVRSAVSQTWPKKEIIIVDDGSSDNTIKIARTFESKTIKVVSQNNMGACAARNKALSIAQGTYIQWLDADDLLAPEKISHQLKGSNDGKISRVLLTSAWAPFFFCYHKAQFKPNSLWQDLDPVDWIMKKFLDSVWMNPTTWLVSRFLTELAGGWDERLSPSGDDDGEYVCRLVSHSERVKFVPEAKCYYRHGNPASLSSNKSDKALSSLFLVRSLSIDHLRSLEDSERTRFACLKYLQNSAFYFYPDNVEIIAKAQNIARDLGGEFRPPSESFKFGLIRKLFGMKTARKLKDTSFRGKLVVLRTWDKLLVDTLNRH